MKCDCDNSNIADAKVDMNKFKRREISSGAKCRTMRQHAHTLEILTLVHNMAYSKDILGALESNKLLNEIISNWNFKTQISIRVCFTQSQI